MKLKRICFDAKFVKNLSTRHDGQHVVAIISQTEICLFLLVQFCSIFSPERHHLPLRRYREHRFSYRYFPI